jgi:hypothetical protein
MEWHWSRVIYRQDRGWFRLASQAAWLPQISRLQQVSFARWTASDRWWTFVFAEGVFRGGEAW